MPSVLTNDPLPNAETPQNANPIAAMNNIINQIMSSQDPKATFNQILQQSPEAKNAMDLINQYGNGDPKQAFMAYANATGRQSFAQQIRSKLGLS